MKVNKTSKKPLVNNSKHTKKVRFAAADVLQKLCAENSSVGGQTGVIKDFIPLIVQYWKKAPYLHRIACVRCVCVLSDFPLAWNAISYWYGEALKDSTVNVILASLNMAKKVIFNSQFFLFCFVLF